MSRRESRILLRAVALVSLQLLTCVACGDRPHGETRAGTAAHPAEEPEARPAGSSGGAGGVTGTENDASGPPVDPDTEPTRAGRAAGGSPPPAERTPSGPAPRVGEGEDRLLADVVSVAVRGGPSGRVFAVGVSSPDEGCARYADWWEVLRPDGSLVYRRVLRHSHTDEQPFVREGGPVPAGADEEVIVRAHMHPAGYGGRAMRGTARGGFQPMDLPAGFAADAAAMPPLPEGCLY